MARENRLVKVNEPIALWHKLLGKPLASFWSRSETTPNLAAGAAGFYAAALGGGGLDPATRARVARCLLWCDAEAGCWSPARLEFYREAIQAFPDDERSMFYLAALCRDRIVVDKPELTVYAYTALQRPEWRASRYWDLFDLPQKAIQDELAMLFATAHGVTPERIEAVEAAYLRRFNDGSAEAVAERATQVAYLARAYRETGRTDENAMGICATHFATRPEDEANTAFLARYYAAQNRSDAAVLGVYAAMASIVEANQPGEWTLRLARTRIAMGRIDQESLPLLRRAAGVAAAERTYDPLLPAAVAYAASQQPIQDDAVLADLAAALACENEVSPVFVARGWDFAQVVRAIALGWGRAGCCDSAALSVFARAAASFPEDSRIWLYWGRALNATGNYTLESVAIYEKAAKASPGDHALMTGLARAYLENDLAQGKDRQKVTAIWEDMYRQGLSWPEMVTALAQAYTLDDRVTDVALAIWSHVVENDPKNGKLRVRLGREWRARGDKDEALKWYKAGARLCPRDFEAQYQTGLLLKEHIGDNAAAEKLLAKAVKLNGKHLNAHFAYGETLLAQEKRDAAKTVFQKIVDEIDANHTPSIMHLARLNLRYDEESVKTAEALYDQVKALDPDQPETYRKLAELYREKGQYQEEQEALEQYLKLSPSNAESQKQLADLYIRRGDYVRAESALRQAIALGHNDKKMYTLLGEIMVQARDKAA